MIDHLAIQLALRTRLLTLSVATTGSTSLSATATGYARAAGSFVADGFGPGMEVAGAGFGVSANNGARTLTAVTASALTCAGCAVEAAGTRTVSAGLPATCGWENTEIDRVTGVPWVDEDYLPGPVTISGVGPLSRMVAAPVYVLRVSVPANVGVTAARKYAAAILALFPPALVLVLASGDSLRVRGDSAPYVGQILNYGPSFAMVPITIPLRCYSINSI